MRDFPGSHRDGRFSEDIQVNKILLQKGDIVFPISSWIVPAFIWFKVSETACKHLMQVNKKEGRFVQIQRVDLAV